ncbi:uncharacterized protein N7482_002637 [Penicillium canariense]|uniref:Uncharacterized protein n=1 Tax=Penicillium canariense TaxID=189055 RepID=A0A9W9IGG0_9EURO|nr:uncharacterized protein N7482_002637 [Penicillium canariense]KAJ5176760.1 hypothetical protein N7482_002637 [Penicillium canariense]
MGAGDDSSFFLYGVGERPEALTLGTLVLEKYWQPMNARHYTHPLLSDQALQEHAYTTNLNNVVFHGSSRVSPSVGVEGLDLINLGLAYNKDLERMSYIVRSPETFFSTSVLNTPLAQQKLKLWLSAAHSDYVLNFKFARRPKVWLLTGLYLLEGARTIVSMGQSSEISVGVSSAIIGALSGVPVGGSVSLGVGSSWEMAMEVSDPHVWAAQYRLLDVHFIKMGKGGVEGVKLPTTMGLYRDIMSVNTARGGEGNSIKLGLEDTESEEGAADDQDSTELEEYEQWLEEAIKIFEKAPKHYLQ